LGGGQEWEGEEGCVVLCLYVGRKGESDQASGFCDDKRFCEMGKWVSFIYTLVPMLVMIHAKH